MTYSIVLGLYLVIISVFVLVSFFIVYHLVRYTINSNLNIILLPVFIIGVAALLIFNLTLFFSTNWNEILLKISL